MGVAAIRKNDDGDDPRDALRAAIATCAAVHAKTEQHEQAVHRARNMRAAAEAKLTLAGEALEATRTKHAEAIAEAAQAGTAPKGNTELRAARLALADAEDEASAARAALDRLDAYGDELELSNPQIENQVLVAAAQVIAPVAERLLGQFQRHLIELEVLKGAFLALTDDIDPVDILFNRDVERLNAKDQRLAPIQGLRDQFFALNYDDGRGRAREIAETWRRWRAALRNDPDAPAPDGADK